MEGHGRSPAIVIPATGHTGAGWLNRYGFWLALALFVAVVVGTALIAASGGVRGSDQYWYLADVETLVREQRVATNNVFPVGLLGDRSGVPPPFLHNILSVYLAALPGFLVGPMGGWLVLNIGSTLVASLLIFGAARRVASPWAALAAGALYPVLPIVAWHTGQPLAEASTSFFAALAVFALSRAGTTLRGWLAVTLAVGLLYLSRQSYLPLLALIPVGFLIVRVQEHAAGLRGAWRPALGIAVAGFALAAAGTLMFNAENVNFSYSRLLHSAVPGKTDNMWFNFDLSPENLADELPVDPSIVASKAAAYLGEQLVGSGSPAVAAFYWTFNALAIVAVVELFRTRNPLRRRLIVAALAMVAIHLVTIVWFHNQFRYTMPALPGLLVVLAMFLSDVSRLERKLAGRSVAPILALVAVTLAPNLYLAQTIRGEGLANGQTEVAVEALFDREMAPDDATLMAFVSAPQVLAYAARPRPVLYVLEEYGQRELGLLLEAFPATWLFAPIDSPLVTALAGGNPPVGESEALGEAWGLYRLP